MNTNINALTAQRTLTATRAAEERSEEHLSAGSRITQASDDAAGLSISEHCKANIRSLSQISRNGLDAISLAQVGEGALSNIAESLIRMRELSIQSASDTLNDTQRSFSDKEVQALKEHIGQVVATTQFNGTKLLTGDSKNMTFQLDLHKSADDQSTIKFNVGELSSTAFDLGVDDVTVASKRQARLNLAKLDYALGIVNENRAYIGAFQNRAQTAVNQFSEYKQDLSAEKSRISDLDYAAETSNQVKNNILEQSGIAVLSQANQNTKQAMRLLE